MAAIQLGEDMSYVLIGGGALAREIADWICHCEGANALAGYCDDAGETDLSKSPYNLNYVGPLMAMTGKMHSHRLVLAVADPVSRAKAGVLIESCGLSLSSFVHSTVIIAPSAVIEDGAILLPYSIVSANAFVSKGACINVHCSVGHDARVGQYCTLASHVDLMGWVSIGDRAFLGSGSRVLPKIAVENDAKVGAGGIVMRRVKAGTTVYGFAAKKL